MLKLKIFSIGKPSKESWLEEGLKEYTRRLQNSLSVEWIFAKDELQLRNFLLGQTQIICLDPQGDLMTSERFSSFLSAQFSQGGSRLSFVIGGAEGLSKELKQKFPLVSLSRLTFTHQLTRLILLEQIYRALEISKGSPYHK